MKPSLQPGISLVRHVTVENEKTVSFMGEEGRVYGTPFLISDIEYTCRDLIMQHAEPGEDSVGIEVAIKHLAPTLPGSTVEITATVTAIEGRKVTFAVTAKDEAVKAKAAEAQRATIRTDLLRARAAVAELSTAAEIVPQLVAFIKQREAQRGHRLAPASA